MAASVLSRERTHPAMAMIRNSKELPLDAVYEILVRLSVTTLIRFRCVCKPWNSLISDPSFQQDHDGRWQRNPSLLVITKAEGLQLFTNNGNNGFTRVNKFYKKYPALYDQYNMIQSCLGLVCIASSKPTASSKPKPVLLCNPSTEEIITLPRSPFGGFIHCIGFGYATSTREFKVVNFNNNGKYCCQIFTVGTTDWRGAKRPPQMYIRMGCAPFVHGSFHLLHHGYDDHHMNLYITAFDIESEEYRDLPVPDDLNNEDWDLKELGGSLSLMKMYQKSHLVCWVLKDYNSGNWVNQYNLDFSPLSYLGISSVAIYADESIWLGVYGPDGKQAICYNLQDKTVTQKILDGASLVLFVERFRPLESWQPDM